VACRLPVDLLLSTLRYAWAQRLRDIPDKVGVFSGTVVDLVKSAAYAQQSAAAP